MGWKFDPQYGDLVFTLLVGEASDPANVTCGESVSSDIAIDTGDRTNDTSTLDQGLRIIEV